MSVDQHADSLSALHAAAEQSEAAGHSIAGFVRHVRRDKGYRFDGRCRRCGLEVSVVPGQVGWTFQRPLPPCPAADAGAA